MDIGGTTILKQGMADNTKITVKEANTACDKHGCIKLNDYFSF